MSLQPKTEETPSIGRKTARATFWLGLARILGRSLGIIRLLVLAAVMPQAQLGLFGLALVVMELVQRLSETGIRQALIQNPREIDQYLGTAWVVQILRGFVLAVIMIALAQNAEDFFDKTGLARLLWLLALVPVVSGFANIGIVQLYRDMQFRTIVVLQLVEAAVELAVAVALSLIWPVAESLAVAVVLRALVTLFGGYVIAHKRGTLAFSMTLFREMYRFGFWVFASAIMTFILVRGGDLVIGKLLPAADLAVYQVAFALACVPVLEITRVFSTTTFSAYSRLQDDTVRLTSAFLRVLFLSSCIAVLAVSGAVLLGKDFTTIALRPEYALVGSLLPWLAIWGACRALGSTNSVLFQAIGKPALATIFQFLMVVLFALCAIPMTMNYGMMGLAYSLAGIGLLAQSFRYLLTARVLKISAGWIYGRVLTAIFCGAVSLLGSYLLLQTIPEHLHILRFACGFVSIILFFGTAALIADKLLDFGLMDYLASNFPFLNRVASVFGARPENSSL